MQKTIKYIFILYGFLFSYLCKSQTANYVANGSFEQFYTCSNPNAISVAKSWRSIDSSIFGNVLFYSTCYSNVPYGPFGFQWAKTGNSFGVTSVLCQPTLCATNNSRGYLRNRLKQNLQAGKTYCVKFYVNLSDNSSYGIDGFGAYFGDNTLDTITQVNGPITYLLPQVQNPTNNIISDTLNWTLVTGTFVANGNEKHMVIGNFKDDASTNKLFINSNNFPHVYTTVLIEDVSCIDINLPAYAGPDIWSIPNNTIYIGRPQDVGIDEACMWYHLPNITTAIDTAAGITLTVGIVTNTYVVRQEICGNVKWDTVVVYPSGVGIKNFNTRRDNIKIYPNPTSEFLNVEFENPNRKVQINFEILNELGQLIRVDEISIKNKSVLINTKDLPNGIYVLRLLEGGQIDINRRFVILH
ncbi:MAG: T9SS type A sorting domain-containing protein [Bacteroidetes bacterium]|nr:T9SS type A sorting domain-containing protein [Bacteroidota bacterium]